MFKKDDLPFRRRTWVDLAAVPKNRIGWELSDCDDTDPADIEIIKKWLKGVGNNKVIRAEGSRTCGVGLLMYGAPGHGKTTLALATLQEAIRTLSLENFAVDENKTMARPCYFMTYSSLLDLKGAMMDDPTDSQIRLWEGLLGECKEDTYNIRVLVIDDVGKEHQATSKWQAAVFHHVVRTRFNNGLPTIVTTNLDLEGLGSAYSAATESFVNEAFVLIELRSLNGDLRQ